MTQKIPVTILSGFLGAGKTTLLRQILQNSGGRRLAVMINEFGELGFDRALVDDCGTANCPSDKIIELTNGCICCRVSEDFLPALEQLLAGEPPPDHIIIETSGLALPKPLIAAFGWPSIAARVTVDGVVTLVDAPAVVAKRFADDPRKVQAMREADPSLDHDNPLQEVFIDQLSAADLVIVNKIDALNERDLSLVEAMVSPYLRRGVKTIATQQAKVPIEILLGLTAAAETDLAARPSVHDGEPEHEHDDFDSFIINLKEIDSPPLLIDRLKSLSHDHDILRIKGLVAVSGKPRRLVIQGVGNRFSSYFDRNWLASESRQSQLVVIGQKGLAKESILSELLQNQL